MGKPVKEGQIIDLEIKEISRRGDGIARVDNFVIFVKGAQTGEKVKTKIVKVMNSFAIGVAIR
ncbi:MAG: TRAM domain-containing protein [Candidatus Aenigmatarchaeota archaeon]